MAQKRTWTEDQILVLRRTYPANMAPSEITTAVNQASGPFITWPQITGKAGYLGLKRGTYDRWHGPAETTSRTSASAHHRKLLAQYGRPCDRCGGWLLTASYEAGGGQCDDCRIYQKEAHVLTGVDDEIESLAPCDRCGRPVEFGTCDRCGVPLCPACHDLSFGRCEACAGDADTKS